MHVRLSCTFSSHLYVSHMYAYFNFNFTSILVLILAHVMPRGKATIGTEYLMHLALIIAATGVGLRVLIIHSAST